MDRPPNLVALDEALDASAAVDPRRSRVVGAAVHRRLRVEETATVLKISPETATRDWRLAKTWLTEVRSSWRPVVPMRLAA
jgi:RNA polymerase sigma-70 factor, ECF subfamily